MKITFTKAQWESIGKQAGWMKEGMSLPAIPEGAESTFEGTDMNPSEIQAVVSTLNSTVKIIEDALSKFSAAAAAIAPDRGFEAPAALRLVPLFMKFNTNYIDPIIVGLKDEATKIAYTTERDNVLFFVKELEKAKINLRQGAENLSRLEKKSENITQLMQEVKGYIASTKVTLVDSISGLKSSVINGLEAILAEKWKAHNAAEDAKSSQAPMAPQASPSGTQTGAQTGANL